MSARPIETVSQLEREPYEPLVDQPMAFYGSQGPRRAWGMFCETKVQTQPEKKL